MENANNHGKDKESRPVRQTDEDGHSIEGLFTYYSLQRVSIKKIRKIEKMKPRENGHLNFDTATSSVTYPDIHKTLKLQDKREKMYYINHTKKKNTLSPENPKLLLLKV